MFKFLAGSSWGLLFLSFGACALVSAVIFPEFLVFHNQEMVLNSFWANYWGAFTLTNFMYQGGIQLWAVYDQLPMAYYALTAGLYKFFTLPVALVYFLFSGFTDHHAEFFHTVYMIVFFLTNLFLKVAGSYLLFRKFTSSQTLAALAAVYSSSVSSAREK